MKKNVERGYGISQGLRKATKPSRPEEIIKGSFESDTRFVLKTQDIVDSRVIRNLPLRVAA